MVTAQQERIQVFFIGGGGRGEGGGEFQTLVWKGLLNCFVANLWNLV